MRIQQESEAADTAIAENPEKSPVAICWSVGPVGPLDARFAAAAFVHPASHRWHGPVVQQIQRTRMQEGLESASGEDPARDVAIPGLQIDYGDTPHLSGHSQQPARPASPKDEDWLILL